MIKRNLDNAFKAITMRHMEVNCLNSDEKPKEDELYEVPHRLDDFKTDDKQLKIFVELLKDDCEIQLDSKTNDNKDMRKYKKKKKAKHNLFDYTRKYKSCHDITCIPKIVEEKRDEFDQDDFMEVDNLNDTMKMMLKHATQKDFQDDEGNEPFKDVEEKDEHGYLKKTNKDIINGMLSGDLVDSMFDSYKTEEVYKIVHYTLLRRKKLMDQCMRLDKLIVIGKTKLHQTQINQQSIINHGYNVKNMSGLHLRKIQNDNKKNCIFL